MSSPLACPPHMAGWPLSSSSPAGASGVVIQGSRAAFITVAYRRTEVGGRLLRLERGLAQPLRASNPRLPLVECDRAKTRLMSHSYRVQRVLRGRGELGIGG
jgi:hypothetical protein